MKKIISAFTAFAIIISMQVCTFADIALENELRKSVNYIYENVPAPTVSSIGGEWAVITLSSCGENIPNEYFEKYLTNAKSEISAKNGILHDKKYTEYSRVTLALSVLGENPENFGGYNISSPLNDIEKVCSQGINGAIWALISLTSSGKNPNGEICTAYKNQILSLQKSDGGWSLSSSAPSDADITAMALTALSVYKNDNVVSSCTNKALVFFEIFTKSIQPEDELYSETVSQIITALCQMQISPESKRFYINGKSLLQTLLSYQNESGAFRHIKSGSDNNMATEQACLALCAYKNFLSGKALFTHGNRNFENSSSSALTPDYADLCVPPYAGDKTFSDIVDHSAKHQIEVLASHGIINGKRDSLFDPDNTMSRAEFATLVTKSLGLELCLENVFSDVGTSDWFAPYVSCAYKYKIVSGISENFFNPNGLITREEAAVMITRAAKLLNMSKTYDDEASRDILSAFEDYVTVSDWAKEAVAFCCDNGIIPSDEIYILPQKEATRAEISVMIFNLLTVAKAL